MNFKDVAVSVKIILKCILKKYFGRERTGLTWLKIGAIPRAVVS